MSTGSERAEPTASTDPATAAGAKPARSRSTIKSLVALLACGGGMLWAGYVLWEDRHPVQAAARGLRSRAVSTRSDAVHKIAELGMSNAGEAIPPLLEAIKDPDAGVRSEAARSLSLVGAYGIRTGVGGDVISAMATALFPTLSDRTVAVRVEAMRALVNLSMTRPPQPGKSAKGAANREPDKWAIEPQRLADAAAEMLADPSDDIRVEAMRTIAAVGKWLKGAPPQALISALADKDPKVRAAAIAAVAGFPEAAEAALPSILKGLRSDEPEVVRVAALRTLNTMQLGGKPEPSNPPVAAVTIARSLMAEVKNPDLEIRLGILTQLAKLDRDARIEALPAFIDALKEPVDTDLQMVNPAGTTYRGPVYVAARALGATAPGTPAADQAIAGLTALATAGPPQRGVAAAAALVEFGTQAAAAVPALAKLLKEIAPADVPARDVATVAQALGRLAPGTPASSVALDALDQALLAPSDAAREAAVKTLAEFGPDGAASAVPPVRALLEKETSPKVRSAAEATLKALGAPPK